MKDALDWIKANTSENCTILCWWDYGHMIEGYAERNAIATFVSLALQYTIPSLLYLDEEEKLQRIELAGGWASNETVEDLAKVLTSNNISSDDIRDIFQKYNVSYILTKGYDKRIATIFFDAIGINYSEHIVDGILTDKGNETLIFQMWNNYSEILELQLLYEYYPQGFPIPNYYDDDVRIFKLIMY